MFAKHAIDVYCERFLLFFFISKKSTNQCSCPWTKFRVNENTHGTLHAHTQTHTVHRFYSTKSPLGLCVYDIGHLDYDLVLRNGFPFFMAIRNSFLASKSIFLFFFMRYGKFDQRRFNNKIKTKIDLTLNKNASLIKFVFQ